ncbi:MAG: type II secretion system protein GspE [Candidatus Omnitrophica bacterium CG11_big_fil_rev_8_21_14_0_20_42_13]|uniref:protein-secreting ATPase n=1 Tax=Candidatus Ghiorseimicrobium undicola TaxID=1974746 RepID=A0A2H0LXH6_9BACT|nr:MAG: type II secretion system protein GspE [Candidatus Omnitrophica bacterium CG11_big_fil_rev_8_21_14_0_20_42_13]
MDKKEKKSLGESLVAEGILTKEQLAAACQQEKNLGLRLRKVLVKMGFIDEDDLVSFLSEKLNILRIELGNYLIDPKIIELVPEELARKHELIPVLKIGNRLTCAMVDPWNIFALDEIRAKTNFIVEPAAATESEIRKAIDEHYGTLGTMEDLIKTVPQDKFSALTEKEIDIKKLQEMIQEPLVIKLVNLIIIKAVHENASDVHIEPEEKILKTKFRVDGLLHEVSSPPKHLQSAVISRIKVLADLDIAERRLPQDGRFQIKMEGREIDIRVSCMPTIYGENVVLRLLDTASALLSLEELGFSEKLLIEYRKLIDFPHGIILVTGPTGCGKTTTLYASLDKINAVEKNIITIEDPVEYRLSGIRQTQVNTKVDLSFANGLRSILRQDPDIIMVGEIRDFETAEIAIQAALTGHLVFSTLHTNDAAGAVTRLMDMGVEPYLASSSIIGVLAQRLARKICPDCKERYDPDAGALKDIGLFEEKKEIKFYRGKGCVKCMNVGFKGRIGIFELLIPDEKIRNLAIAKFPHQKIKEQAIESGMITLRQSGIDKIKNGLTTIEEVLRLTRDA